MNIAGWIKTTVDRITIREMSPVVFYDKAWYNNVRREKQAAASADICFSQAINEDDLDDIYTDPEVAKKFVELTGVDCLAVAFGTTHGVYLTEPKLDLPRV